VAYAEQTQGMTIISGVEALVIWVQQLMQFILLLELFQKHWFGFAC